jgi:large subunit ribosomal protein L29
MAKASELREMSDEQLALTLKETSGNLFHLRLQAQTERLDAPSELRKQRRTIARIQTIQNQRKRAASQKAAEQAAQMGTVEQQEPAHA